MTKENFFTILKFELTEQMLGQYGFSNSRALLKQSLNVPANLSGSHLSRTSDPNISMASVQTTRPREQSQKQHWFPSCQSSDWLSTLLRWLRKPPPIIDGQLYSLHAVGTKGTDGKLAETRRGRHCLNIHFAPHRAPCGIFIEICDPFLRVVPTNLFHFFVFDFTCFHCQ